MIIKKINNKNRKALALAAVGVATAAISTTQVANADIAGDQASARNELQVSIGRALAFKSTSDYRNASEKYKIAFDKALNDAYNISDNATADQIKNIALDLENALYDASDPQNKALTNTQIAEVKSKTNILRDLKNNPLYAQVSADIKAELEDAINEAMNIDKNPTRGQYDRTLTKVKQAEIDVRNEFDRILHRNSNASSSASIAGTSSASATSSTSSSMTSSSNSNVSSTAESSSSSNTSHASSTSSSSSSVSSDTSSVSSAISDAGLKSVASSAANAFSNAISVLTSSATNIQSSASTGQSNSSTGTPAEKLKNAINELKKIKNGSVYKTLTDEEKKEIDNQLEKAEALSNDPNATDDEITKMVNQTNDVSRKYVNTTWVDENGNVIKDTEKGYHPDNDGKSDISGYVFAYADTDENGNVVNHYKKQSTSENKTYYYDSQGNRIRDAINGAHVDHGQDTISGYKVMGSYTLTDKDVAKGGDFYGLGMHAGDVINLYTKDDQSSNASSAVSSADGSNASSNASSVVDSNASSANNNDIAVSSAVSSDVNHKTSDVDSTNDNSTDNVANAGSATDNSENSDNVKGDNESTDESPSDNQAANNNANTGSQEATRQNAKVDNAGQNTSNQNVPVATQNSTLPQTGDTGSNIVAALGAALFTATGLLGVKRKKHE